MKLANVPIFSKDPQISLKKDRSHIDFDIDYFYETYVKLREKRIDADEKLIQTYESAKQKQELQNHLDKFREQTFGDKYMEAFRESPPKRQSIKADMNPEEQLKDIINSGKLTEEKIRKDLEEILVDQTKSQFSAKPFPELNLQSDDEGDYAPGRNFSKKVQKEDLQKLMSKIQQKLETDNKLAPQGYSDAIKELIATNYGVGKKTTPILAKFEQYLNTEHKYGKIKTQQKEFGKIQDILDKAESQRKAVAGRKRRAEDRRAANEAAEGETKEDTYFDPFKQDRNQKQDKAELEEALRQYFCGL
jgi:hypothetical protein